MICKPIDPRCSRCGTRGYDNLRMLPTLEVELPLEFYRNLPKTIDLINSENRNIVCVNWDQKNANLICKTCGLTGDFTEFENAGFAENAYTIVRGEEEPEPEPDPDPPEPDPDPPEPDPDPPEPDPEPAEPEMNYRLLWSLIILMLLSILLYLLTPLGFPSLVIAYIVLSTASMYYQLYARSLGARMVVGIATMIISVLFGMYAFLLSNTVVV